MHTTMRHPEADHANECCSVVLHGSFAEYELARRVRSEFREMPGMRLTLDQASRLWTLDRGACARVLENLIAARFLELDDNGRYRKAHSGY